MKRPAIPEAVFVAAGSACTAGAGATYFVLLHEPGAWFYPFAIAALVVGPVVAGVGRARRGVALFLTVAIAFFVLYAVVPWFEISSVRLPDSCVDRPLREAAVSVTSAANRAVVATVGKQSPYPSSVRLVDTTNRRVLATLWFPNDVIMAAIHDGVAYIYNDKLGYWFDAQSGRTPGAFLTIDNYAGLSRTAHPVLMNQPGDAWYVQNTGIVSSWFTNGAVRSRPWMYFNAIARGCFVDGATRRVVAL